MADSPAFQFYPSDFTGSSTVGTADSYEICAYTMLLCLDWMETGFAYDEPRLARWCRISRPQFKKAWAHLASKFPERDGRHYNPRLERERVKQAEHRARQSTKGKAGAEKRWPKDGHGDSPGHSTGNAEPMAEGIPGDSSLISHLSVPTTAPTPVRQKREPRERHENWVAEVTESWVRQVGHVTYGRVGADLRVSHATHGLPALLAAVDNFAKHRSLAVAGGKSADRWPQFVADLTDYIPPTLRNQGVAA